MQSGPDTRSSCVSATAPTISDRPTRKNAQGLLIHLMLVRVTVWAPGTSHLFRWAFLQTMSWGPRYLETTPYTGPIWLSAICDMGILADSDDGKYEHEVTGGGVPQSPPPRMSFWPHLESRASSFRGWI